jgi:hypothetical protein
MVKICQTGLLTLNFEIIPKKCIFRYLPKIFHRPCMKLKIFLGQFPNLWTLRVSGMGGYTSKCEKSQNHCTLMYIECVSAKIISDPPPPNPPLEFRKWCYKVARQKFRPKSSKGAEFWLILPKTGRKGAAENLYCILYIKNQIYHSYHS